MKMNKIFVVFCLSFCILQKCDLADRGDESRPDKHFTEEKELERCPICYLNWSDEVIPCEPCKNCEQYWCEECSYRLRFSITEKKARRRNRIKVKKTWDPKTCPFCRHPIWCYRCRKVLPEGEN
ncbi:hypothetical protein ACFLY6_02395, partial [Candidatus Dependentiae bacterium]